VSRYRARQLATIREAVAAGRDALRRAGSQDPRVFARAFVEAGGVQIPGDPGDTAAAAELAEALLRSLERGEHSHPASPHLQRELDRALREVRWTAAQTDDKIVGFYMQVPERLMDDPGVEAMSHENQGLGPGVFRKADILVLQPQFDGVRFIPVLEDEIEC